MSRYFSSLDLYNSVVDSDLESLRKGIFFLGIRIHSFKIHRSVPALIFAAKLCKLDVVEFLLDDFLKYSRSFDARTTLVMDWRLRKDILARLMAALGEHLSNQQYHDRIEKLIIRMRDLLFINSGEESAIRELVRIEAFHLFDVQVITKGARFRVTERIEWLIKWCVKLHKRQLFALPVEIQNDWAFVDYLSRRVEWGLKFAIIRGNIEEIRQSVVVAQKFNVNESFMREVAEVNGVDIFQALTDDVTVNHFRDMYPTHDYMNLRNLLPRFLREATKVQSCELTQAILNHKLYPRNDEDWLALYYELISKGCVRSAACLKHLVDFSDQEKKDHIFHTVFETKGLDLLPDDITTEDLLEVVEQVEALCTDTAEPNSPWRQKLVQYPLKKLRPEIVKPFRKYGVSYTEREVLNAIQSHDKSSKSQLELLLSPTDQSNKIELSFKSSSMCTIFMGDCSTDPVIVMDAPRPRCSQRQYFLNLLEVCVVETGKQVGLICQDITKLVIQSMIDTIESKRRASLTLKKLCRLAVRKSVILSCKTTNGALDVVEDSTLSLYVDGYLPKRMVDYILYRDGGEPLYHYLLWHRTTI